MGIYGPLTVDEQQASQASAAAASYAVASAAERKALSAYVHGSLAAAVSSKGAELTQSMQNKMEDASKTIYGWGYQIFDGMDGKAASGASDKLRDLSAIKGFDDAVTDIKLKK